MFLNKKILFACAGLEAFLVLLIAAVSLNLWQYDLRVPFQYSGDSVVMMMYIKGMIQNGWTFSIPQLSAPYGMSAAAFPIMTNFDWCIMKAISLFASNVGLVLNFFWLLTLVFSAWTASFSIRLLGVSNWLAFAGGILYAFLPFALLRNVGHLNLVYYAVPLLCLFAIHLSGWKYGGVREKTIHRLGYAGCLIQSFNYVYYSFFAVLLFIVTAAVGYARNRSLSVVKTAGIAIGIISIATVVNLSPSFLSWYKHGKPPGMAYKSTAEAEYYGAKVRKILAPHPDNPIPYLAKWGKRDATAGFPNENENITVRQGLYGSLGFLLLLWVSLTSIKPGNNATSGTLACIAPPALFTLLMISVGGFGVVFNLLTVPDIRCYNRFSVYLAFFSIAGLCVLLSDLLCKITRIYFKCALIAVILIVVFLSLYDQLLDGRHLVNRQMLDSTTAAEEVALVKKLEKTLPYNAMVFQLPITPFPVDPGTFQMGVYDHGRPFLWSNQLRWSWPSFSQKHRLWQDKISHLEGETLIRALVFSGFHAIWVDRFGYKDNGTSVIQGLMEAGGQEILTGISSRYVMVDIREPAKHLEYSIGEIRFREESASFLNGVTLNWTNGFYDEEVNSDGHKYRWSKKRSSLTVFNPDSEMHNVRLVFKLASEAVGIVEMHSSGVTLNAQTSSEPVDYLLDFPLGPGDKEDIEFIANLARVYAPNDPRLLYFYVMDLQVQDKRADKGVNDVN